MTGRRVPEEPASPSTSPPSSPASEPSISVRPANQQDGDRLAELFWRVRSQSVPHIPMIVHPRESMLPFVEEVLLSQFEVWVAEKADVPVGFMALMPPDQLSHLYVDRRYTGTGLGSRLLALARERFPEGIQLWTFQANEGALRFYSRHGFVPVEWTDGENEEGAPDVRMVWSPGVV
ncbi:GNAT family N-acetyltransferase [Pedococcus sp. 5OH_020]|uniref:GNAT family N-acetyltransferase n=1 Tax=Pedococcus sp. 5OH_020 TaxID=2989814 RepID=UPI0022E9BA21|nr:GNAT family N-acetyltransferase [Pedococcus sp. 5OH_020]